MGCGKNFNCSRHSNCPNVHGSPRSKQKAEVFRAGRVFFLLRRNRDAGSTGLLDEIFFGTPSALRVYTAVNQ